VSDIMPAIGTLTDRVQLKRRIVSGEDEGGQTALFSPIAYVWARVRQLAARPMTDNDARGQAITHSVVLRFRSDLGPGDRISYRGRDLDIVAANDLNGRRVYLSCQCGERVVTG
jgi:SPP1 family predicted phage head-tail adaptor